jgi:hypothetical protein
MNCLWIVTAPKLSKEGGGVHTSRIGAIGACVVWWLLASTTTLKYVHIAQEMLARQIGPYTDA